MRLAVYDRPGAAAGIARHMAENDISLESILQRRSEAAALDPTGRIRRPGAGGADHLCDERGRGARGDPADAEDGLIAEDAQVSGSRENKSNRGRRAAITFGGWPPMA